MPPSVSNCSSSQRFVIQNVNHIYGRTGLAKVERRVSRQTYLGRQVDFVAVECEETVFCREGTDGYDALKQLAEIREDRATSVGLHSAQVASSVEVTNGKTAVEEPEDSCGEDEKRENDATTCVSNTREVLRTP